LCVAKKKKNPMRKRKPIFPTNWEAQKKCRRWRGERVFPDGLPEKGARRETLGEKEKGGKENEELEG